MKIHRVNNILSSENFPSIQSVGGNEWWYLNGKLHRSRAPAVVGKYGTRLYFWRGINITYSMANAELSMKEILSIGNMEQRQASMEILGYEKFLKYAVFIDKFTPDQFKKEYPVDTNPMYQLYEIKEIVSDDKEKIKLLIMVDPSKKPQIKYFIRVPPNETLCKDAVAHSYQYDAWGKFVRDKNWV